MSRAIGDGSQHTGETFGGTTLRGETLRHVEFQDCVFDHCRMDEATFDHCRFSSCRFVRCDLSIVKLPNCRVGNLAFTASKLLGVDWTKLEPPQTKGVALALSFTECVLDLSTFFGTNLRGSSLIRCSARDADFAEADMRDAVCEGTDFSGAKFHTTNLEGANFVGASNYVIDPTANKVRGARFALPEAVSLLRGLHVIVE